MQALGFVNNHAPPLRKFQEEALRSLAQNQHVLCIAATGSGKSRIFQEHISRDSKRTLILSPLISLSRQIREDLASLGETTFLDTGNSRERPRIDQSGTWITSPEKVFPNDKEILSDLIAWNPDFIVVDEAHCYWEWGESFRPPYSEIPRLLASLPKAKSLWLTATMPRAGTTSLKRSVPGLRVVGQFEFPKNIRMNLLETPLHARLRWLESFVRSQGRGRSGIVFAATRKSSEHVYRLVREFHPRSALYHAGLCQEERTCIEHEIKGNGESKLIVATSAFGLGLNLKDVSWVVCIQPAYSLLSLTQMLGRAGRSGQAAEGFVFWDYFDLRLIAEGRGERTDRLQTDWLAMQEFFKTSGCKIDQLHSYFGSEMKLRPCRRCNYCIN